MTDLISVSGVGFDAAHLILLLMACACVGMVFRLRSTAMLARSQAEARIETLERDIDRVSGEAAHLSQTVETQRAVADEARQKLAAAEARREEDERRFAELAQGVMQRATGQFMQLANATFEKHNEGARGSLEKLMTPIHETFSEFKKRVESIEKVRIEDRSSLGEQIKAITEGLQRQSRATNKLVTALSAPRGAGSWGEESLRNVMELAGMSAYADFAEQTSAETESGRLRPDVIIRMPGGREIVVDAKASMEDFLRASDEADDALRSQHLAAHARKLRDQVKRLAGKEYWKQFDDRVDFVAMYVPGEQFYSAAVEVDRELFDFAARNRVLIVTPSTLIALAKAVAYGWRQEEAAKNAREAQEIGSQLFDRLSTMGSHLDRLGKSLNASVDNFNKMNRSLETRVMPAARKFQTLQIAPPGKELTEASEIETRASLPDRSGELRFEEDEAPGEAAE